MTDNFGTGISRVLDPQQTQMTQVIWQKNKPPLDAELNLLQQLSTDWRKTLTLRGTPSGWVGNGINDSSAFVTNPTWSNWFRFGQQRTGEKQSIQWAVVNGWLIPVTGTLTGTPPGSPNDTDTWNKITLGPPPSNSGDSRIDFVFLEVWQARIVPDPSTVNKPSAASIYKYGNVESGYTFLTDDIIDPELGFETTQRVQVQYRIRVVTGLVGLTTFPDGFDPANVKGRGAAAADTAFTFTNMRSELGDPGLWRAGDGSANSLGTVDGYTYAVPLAVVFRRNSVAWDGDPGQNLNGGFNRNPTAVDRTGITTFSTTPTLAADMDASQLTLTLTSAANIPLPASPATAVTIKVGDEIMTYSAITGTTVTLASRGALGSKAEVHSTGDVVQVVSSRPDALFSDQIIPDDILDLRHIVNPNGFDYRSLLRGNLDKCLRGHLKSNWKRSGGGPQGTMVFYQDKVSSSAAALGVSKLDAPDNIRQIFSDASVLQPVEFIATPPTGSGVAEDISTTWGLGLTGSVDNSGGSANQWSDGDIITIPVAQFKSTVAGSDADQISFPKRAASASPAIIKIRVAGLESDLTEGVNFTVTTPTGPNDDLVITLDDIQSTVNTEILFITFHVQYGGGRGLSRRPDRYHSTAYLNAASGTMLRQQGVPSNNIPLSVAYAPLWSKYRTGVFNSQLPVTAESYVDPGSKTLILNPFRRLDLPPAPFRATRNTTLHGALGPMPDSGKFGGTNDPLTLFSSGAEAGAGGSTFMILPRNLMPGWGAVHCPIIHTDTADFAEGINFGFRVPKGLAAGTEHSNFIPNQNTRITTFSTEDLNTDTSATYNTAFTFTIPIAGIRHFTDSRGLSREGLELPPFYGIARLFAVYESQDYKSNLSNYNVDRTLKGAPASTNLLRQDFDGPTFWIEIDSDGDSTFILNAEAIDISKSPNAIASFATGNYVVEAEIFGFDRGAFDLTEDCRIVLPRSRPDATDAVADPDLQVDSVSLAVPGPPQGSESIAANYSRNVYQGDVWGSQGAQQDIPQLTGPLTSGTANSIGFTELDLDTLSRPNPKVLEVLDSIGFMTTLGTGRMSGDFDSTAELDFRYPGYEDASVYPPSSPVAARPEWEVGATNPTLTTLDGLLPLGTDYSGCTTRLPLGALFRDKDFRGNVIHTEINSHPLGLMFQEAVGGMTSGLGGNPETRDAPVFMTSQSSGAPGEILVHLDGENGNYSLLTNYRTSRGGSVFVASGPRPGGELSAQLSRQASLSNYNSTLVGVAYLVRNTVTSIGAAEASAGQELQMLIATTVIRNDGATKPLFVTIGSQGTGEGFSAADVFRLEGRPLTNDGVRHNIDSTTIPLSSPISYKPSI